MGTALKAMGASALAAVAILAASGGAWWHHSTSTEQSLRRACVDVLSERLRAPATLDVIEWSAVERREATMDEMIGQEPKRSQYYMIGHFLDARDAWRASRDRLAAEPKDIVTMRFTYDAANGYGTPIRERANCSHLLSSGDGGRGSISDARAKVDGRSSHEWVMEKLKEERESKSQ